MLPVDAPAGWRAYRAGMNRAETGRSRDVEMVGAPPTARPEPGLSKVYVGVPRLALPTVSPPSVGLGDLLEGRASCRRFGGEPMTLHELAVLLHSAYGVFSECVGLTGMLKDRPVPSGGARFPLELYVVVRRLDGVPAGVHHVAPRPPGEVSFLEQLRGPVPWPRMVRLFLDQPYLEPVDALVVITGVSSRTLKRYGERGARFLWLESGHVAQNLTLAATALGLGSLPLAGFFDEPLAALLGVDPQVEPPLYAVALGRPTTQDRRLARLPPASGG